MTPVRSPDFGGVATLTAWYVRVGDRVVAGDRIAEVLLPGIAVDVSAEVSGTLVEVSKLAGDRVEPGDELARIVEG